MRYKILVFILFFIWGENSTFAQDIHFSQFQHTQPLLNPSASGLGLRFNSALIYRSQWSAITDPYQTTAALVDFAMTNNLDKSYWGFGTYVYNDVAGEGKMGTLQANLNAAYHLKISELSFFSIGFTGGLLQKRANTSNLKWETQYVNYIYDPTFPNGEVVAGKNNFLSPDLGVGLNWKYQNGEEYMTANDFVRFEAGFSLHHIITAGHSFYDEDDLLKRKLNFYSLAVKGIRNSRINVEPMVFYSMQEKQMELVIGSGVRYKFKTESVYTGFVKSNSVAFNLLYRNRDALIIQAQADWNNYVFGIGYDINISGLTEATNARGATEIMIKYVIPFQSKLEETLPAN